jgi:hypothetical protein
MMRRGLAILIGYVGRRGRALGTALTKERGLAPLRAWAWRSHAAIEATLAIVLVSTGVGLVLSLGAALITVGLALLTPLVWPSLRRTR